MIPKRLQVEGIKFVLLEKSGKKPFQIGWQNKNIAYNESELLHHLISGGNYGVMGGGSKNLVIVDFDNLELQDKILPLLPNTFTIRTGTGKLHLYFTSNNTESFKIFDEQMNTLADIQGEGKQVVGAGSTHPNGNKYEVLKDSEIAFIDYAELKALFMPHDKKPKKQEIKQAFVKTEVKDDFLDSLKRKLGVGDVLRDFGIDTNRNPTQCPFHESSGGKCLGFNHETAHCFHCDGSWNIFSLVKDFKKYDFKQALDYLSNLCGLQDELAISRKKWKDSQLEIEKDNKENILNQYLRLISYQNPQWAEASELLKDYIKSQLTIYTTKHDIKPEMWIYKEGIYSPHGRAEIKSILCSLLGKYYSIYISNLVINKLEASTFIEEANFFENNYKNELPVQNGLLNLNTKELMPFSSQKIFFSKLPLKYNPSATCLKIDNFLSDVLANENDKVVFYEMVGYCLYKQNIYDKAFMLVGNGRNGKTKCLELIKRLLGQENTFGLSLVALNSGNADVSQLHGKMVNLAGDISNTDLKETGLFKELVSSDLVTSRRKFLSALSFENYAKFIFSCNELPMVWDNSFGFWNRWIMFEFPYKFVDEQEMKLIGDKTNLKIRDVNVLDKICSIEELEGLLNKALEGLDRLFKNGKFSSTIGTEDIKNKWMRRANSFTAFAMDNLEAEYDRKISKKLLRKKYSMYCKEHKVSPKSDYVVRKYLQDEFGASEERTQQGFDNEWYWGGIKWKNEL